MKSQIYLLPAFVAMLLVGCSNKVAVKPVTNPSVLLEKHEQLPSWVNAEDKDLFSAVGSARYKSQTYTQQKSEAQLSASAELVGKIEKRINTLMKTYHQSTGQNDATVEDVFRQTSSSIASQTVSGVIVKEVYISKDGEMFVKVAIDPKYFSGVIKGSMQTNRTAWQQVQAQKAFDELEMQAKQYREESIAVPMVKTADTNTSTGA
ncbi:MAG: hypothetical protein WC680_11170 [Sulfuricurvum sp.]|jgi:PBP1b-binding outer membrane lipoprotein LpoB